MTRKNFIVLAPLLFLCISQVTVAQGRLEGKLEHLKTWAGKYPTQRKGRVTTSFFALPEIRAPLLQLLKRPDFNLLTREYGVESLIKQIGDYLVVQVCRAHNCGDEHGALVINLRSGDMYVRMKDEEKVRWFASKGNAKDLPQAVQDDLNDGSS